MNTMLQTKKNQIITFLILPLSSVLIFFSFLELCLYLVDYKPYLKSGENHLMPFWARNAASISSGLPKLLEDRGELTNDVLLAYEDDLYLNYKLKPNINIKVDFWDFSGMQLEGTFPAWNIVSDRHGRRVSPAAFLPEVKKHDNHGKDVVLLGGSSVFGWGTDYENTFAHKLELLIDSNSPGHQYEFINYGVPGYAMNQHLILLKKILAQKNLPALIVLDATSNCDAPASMSDKQMDVYRQKFVVQLRYYLEQLRFFQLLEVLVSRFRPVTKEIVQGMPRESIEDFEEYVNEAIDIIQEKKIHLILVGLCASQPYLDKLESIANEHAIAHVVFNDLVDSTLHDLERVPIIAREYEMLKDVYKKNELADDPSLHLLFPDKCHPNAIGHGVLAHKLYSLILEENLLYLQQQ